MLGAAENDIAEKFASAIKNVLLLPLLCLDSLPVAQHRVAVAGLLRAEDVGVAADQLVAYSPDHVPHVEGSGLPRQRRDEHHLEQQVPSKIGRASCRERV